MKKVCQICKRGESATELITADIVRPAVSELIKKKYPRWNVKGFICREDLQTFRNEYLYKIMEDEKGALTDLEKDVIDKLLEHETISINTENEFEATLSFGERLSDKIAEFGGSWYFIIFFGIIIFSWIGINTYVLYSKPFDPYPFILLNLILSCVAAMQAPIIMMSQNRQEDRDRKRSEEDYKINLKAELELRQLHQKVDHLLVRQWERMVGIQELQLELLEEIRKYPK